MWEPAWAVLDDEVRAGAFPGAVAAVYVGPRRETAVKAVGRLLPPALDPDGSSPPTDIGTVYDLASVTKSFVTVAAMQCVERGLFRVEDRVADHLDAFRRDGRRDVTVGHLLTHTAGVPSVPQLYEQCPSADDLRAAFDRLPLDFAPGSDVAYTSLGYQYLGDLIERATGRPLDEYIAAEIAEPLGLARTRFTPPPVWRPSIAPTEESDRRDRLLRGEVHDENCSLLGGVQGHAGLFGSAGDVLRLGVALAEGGSLASRAILRPETVELMSRPRTVGMRQTRSLGWVVDDPNFGDWGTPTVSHTGFTGTSLCYVPALRVAVVLLSNRVCPTRRNERIHEARRRFHEAVREIVVARVAAAS